jgi:hypothetical protein
MDVLTKEKQLPVIVVFKNPLDVTDRVEAVASPDTELFAWLLEHYPNGFGRPITIILNGQTIPVEESDVKLKHDDVVGILVGPTAAALPLIFKALITAAIAIAASFAVRLIFGKPKGPNNQAQNPDPVYSLQGGANTARLGEPIPVCYGRTINYPDYVCPPYSFFQNNEQYIDQVLCLGQGDYQIHDLLISDTPASTLASGTLTWRQWASGQHLQRVGTIAAATGVLETVVTSIEVSDIELSGQAGNASWQTFPIVADIISPTEIQLSTPVPSGVGVGSIAFVYGVSYSITAINGQTLTVNGQMTPATGITVVLYVFSAASGYSAGPFVASPPTTKGTEIQLDFVFPAGLYIQNEKTGNLENATVSATATIQPIDDNGAPAGAAITRNFSWTRKTNTPQRITETITGLPAARYSVQVVRNTPAAPNTRTQTVFVWTGLKARLEDFTGKAYGDVTLVSVRIKATGGISSDAANRIRIASTRRLPRLGAGVPAPTRDPADAICDIITNGVYGAARPLSEVDTARLSVLSSYWGAEGLFDGIINNPSTVWEALQLVSQTVACFPAINGPQVTLIQDGKRQFPTQMFASANIIEGTFRANYSFDKPGDYDGIQVEYRSPVDFSPQVVRYPLDSVSPEATNLFGCTTKSIAERYARLLWQRRRYQRLTTEFETELEGLLPAIGDRVSLSNEIIEWGASGEVAYYVAGSNTVLLDRGIDWAQYPNASMIFRNESGNPSAPIAATKGQNARTVSLAAPIPVIIRNSNEDKGFSLWAIGSAQRSIQDATVVNIEPQGGNVVRLQLANYDERVWSGALNFQNGNVPW